MMGSFNAMYMSVLVGAFMCLCSCAVGYPMMDNKDGKFVPETDSSLDDDSAKLSPDQLQKRIFDPIEAASNFGSFGKRYNPYRIWGFTKNPGDSQKLMSGDDIAEMLKQVLAMAIARRGHYVRDTPNEKRQFDRIGYGMFARFG